MSDIKGRTLQRLQIENYKGIRYLDVVIASDAVEFVGAHGQGKTSGLESVLTVVQGAKAIPDEPRRHGETRSKIVGTFDGIKVTRQWTPKSGKNGVLKIEAEDGGKWGQRDLDELWGEGTLDPTELDRMSNAEHGAICERLCGPEFVAGLAQRTEQIKAAESRQTEANSALKRLGTATPCDQVKRVNSADIRKRLDDAEAHNAEQERRVGAIDRARRDTDLVSANLDALRRKVADQERLLASLQADLDKLVEPKSVKDKSLIVDELAAVDQINAAAQRYDDFKAKAKAISDAAREANAAKDDLADLREERKEFAATASENLPVEGLTWDQDGMRLGKTLYHQLSSSERIKLGALLGMRSAPELGVMLIRYADLLNDGAFDDLREAVRVEAKRQNRRFVILLESCRGAHAGNRPHQIVEIVDGEELGA